MLCFCRPELDGVRPEATLLNGLQDGGCEVAHFDYECVPVLHLPGLPPGVMELLALKKRPTLTVLFFCFVFF